MSKLLNTKSLRDAKTLSDKLSKDLKFIINLGLKIGEQSSQELIEDLHGRRFKDGKSYIYTKEFLHSITIFTSDVVSHFGKLVIDEDYVTSLIWDLIDLDLDHSLVVKEFANRLTKEIAEDKFCILHNYQIGFEEGVEEFQIGPVRAVKGRKIASQINRKNENPLWRLDVNFDGHKDDYNTIVYSLSPICWEVRVNTTSKNVKTEAIWNINVALSLLRIVISREEIGPSFPYLGDVEPQVAIRPEFRDKIVIHNSEGIAGGDWGQPKGYYINSKTARTLKTKKFIKRAEMLFDPPQRTLAERVQSGLGWLTRGRQSAEQAERYLFFFTALEAIFTSSDKTTPVTDTISRSISVILMNNNIERAKHFNYMKQSYSIRSALVHGGSRGVSRRDTMSIQAVCDVVYGKLVREFDLSIKLEDFHNRLRNASFGGKWIMKPRIIKE